MEKNLLIVFVKNAKLGKVKTRLAKTIGDEKALAVYKQLLDLTEGCIKKVLAEKRVYFSEEIEEENWTCSSKYAQEGNDLGERMFKAFDHGFSQGYEKIVLIGSDLPEISPAVIQNGFDLLGNNDLVFGPAVDGGYYLVGMKKPQKFVFENKPWSLPELLDTTLTELKEKGISFSLLKTLNDIDTFDDLKSSKLYTDA